MQVPSVNENGICSLRELRGLLQTYLRLRRTNPARELIHRITFQREWGKSQQAKNRHFKVFRMACKWNRVDPFPARPVVPKLPEEAANHTGNKKQPEFLPLPFLDFPIDRRNAKLV